MVGWFHDMPKWSPKLEKWSPLKKSFSENPIFGRPAMNHSFFARNFFFFRASFPSKNGFDFFYFRQKFLIWYFLEGFCTNYPEKKTLIGILYTPWPHGGSLQMLQTRLVKPGHFFEKCPGFFNPIILKLETCFFKKKRGNHQRRVSTFLHADFRSLEILKNRRFIHISENNISEHPLIILIR